MITNKVRRITLEARSVVEVADGDSTKTVMIEGYSCSIDSENPESMSVSKYFVNDDAKKAYADHRTECRADWRAFQDAAQELQDELFDALEAAESVEESVEA